MPIHLPAMAENTPPIYYQPSPAHRGTKQLGTVEEYVQIVLTRKLEECHSVLGDFSSSLEVEKVYEDRLTMGIGNA